MNQLMIKLGTKRKTKKNHSLLLCLLCFSPSVPSTYFLLTLGITGRFSPFIRIYKKKGKFIMKHSHNLDITTSWMYQNSLSAALLFPQSCWNPSPTDLPRNDWRFPLIWKQIDRWWLHCRHSSYFSQHPLEKQQRSMPLNSLKPQV